MVSSKKVLQKSVSTTRYILIMLCITAFASRTSAQNQTEKSLSQQFGVTCDNNFLLFNGEDGYYTSGLVLRYDRVSPTSVPTRKKIRSYEIGQMIFTAYSRKILPQPSGNFPGGVDQIDRPIAGYLYGKITQSSFYGDRKMLTIGMSVGTIGPNSLGRNVQEFWHQIIDVKPYWNWVWDYEVKNEVGINAHGNFAHAFVSHEKFSFYQITSLTRVTLGTTFSDASQSLVFQVGRLRPISSSGFWHSRVQSEPLKAERQGEFFFYYKPEVKYQLYNATIQGGMFRDDKGKVTGSLEPLIFSHAIGLSFSRPRYSITYQVVFQSREVIGQFNNQGYASLAASFRFG